MCDCDPGCGPPASGMDPRKIDKPNPVPLVAGQWQSVSIKYPSTVVLMGVDPLGNLIAVPETEKGSLTEVYTSKGTGADRVLFLHAPGVWRIRNTGSVNVTALVLDTYSCCAAEFYGGFGGGASAVGGVPVMAAPSSVAVGAASALAVAANAARKTLYMRNVSPAGQVISLGFGSAAVLADGITLNVNDWVAFDLTTYCPRDQVNAIASAAAGKLAFQQGT